MVSVGYSVLLTKDFDAKPYSGHSVQPAVFNPKLFDALDHNEISASLRGEGVNVLSFHFPELDVFDKGFLRSVEKVVSEYNTRFITLHGGYGTPFRARKLLDENSKEIENLGVMLAYENFDRCKHRRPEGRWIRHASGVHSLPYPFTFLTYDTSHVPFSTNLADEVHSLILKTPIIHLSNVTKGEKGVHNHMPIEGGIFDIDELLKRLRYADYKGQIILEYNGHEEQKKRDFERVRDYFMAP